MRIGSQLVDHIGIAELAGQVQGVGVGILVAILGRILGRSLNVEVQIQHLDAGLFKELIDEGNGFSAVAEANLHALDGIDANDLLQQHQGNQHQRAAAQRQPIIAVARHNAQARGVPQGGGSCQAGDLLALSEDGARAQEADAAILAEFERERINKKAARTSVFAAGRLRGYIIAAACLTGLSFFVDNALYYRLMAAACLCFGATSWWLGKTSAEA